MIQEEENKKSTKDTFLIEALRLFAQKGYEAVSVGQIAKAVNVSAPALYKHYASKQELFESIIEASNEGYERHMRMLKLDFENNLEMRRAYVNMTEEEQIDIIQKQFLHALHDEFTALFRKLMIVEQFHMPELAAIYNERYVESKLRAHDAVFKLLIEEGKMRPADVRILSMQYLAPMYTLISVCDREPQKEQWALDTIADYVKEFNRNYRIEW